MNSIFKMAFKRAFPGITDDILLGRYTKQWVLPRDLRDNISIDDPDYCLPSLESSHPGINLNVEDQIKRIQGWSETYQEYYRILRMDPEINKIPLADLPPEEWYIRNGYYPSPDAEIYASMILDFKPRQIIEIGSGYSTCIARGALNYGNIACKIIACDPQPRKDITRFADTVYYDYVENLDINIFDFDERTLLFIDSSHICHIGGDIPFLYLQMIPNLSKDSLVHIHDIFIPYDYPVCYHRLLYNEQYLLQAMLSYSARYKVVLSTHYLSRKFPKVMQQCFGKSVAGAKPEIQGASFWLSV